MLCVQRRHAARSGGDRGRSIHIVGLGGPCHRQKIQDLYFFLRPAGETYAAAPQPGARRIGNAHHEPHCRRRVGRAAAAQQHTVRDGDSHRVVSGGDPVYLKRLCLRLGAGSAIDRPQRIGHVEAATGREQNHEGYRQR